MANLENLSPEDLALLTMLRQSNAQKVTMYRHPNGDLEVTHTYSRQYVDSERATPIRSTALQYGDYSKETLPWPDMIYAYLGEENPNG